MRDEQRLVLVPLHMAQKILGRLDHMLAGRLLVGRPVEAQMFDGVLGCPAAGANAGFLLEQFGIAGRPQHFVDGGRDVIVGAVEGVGPADALGRLGLGIMREIGGKPLERAAAGENADDHRGRRPISARISVSRGSRSAGTGSPELCKCRII